jgi:hypothetical protein
MGMRSRWISFKLKIAFAASALCLTAVVLPHCIEATAATPAIHSAANATTSTDDHIVATDVSARRRRYVRRYRNDAAARAFLGAAIGAVGAAIADQRRQDYYRQQYYYGGNPYYGGRYYGAPGYYDRGY